MDVPDKVMQEEGHTGFLHLPSTVLALFFLARRIQPSFFSSTMKSSFVYPRINRSPLVGHDLVIFHFIFFVRKNPSSCDCTEIRTHVIMSEPPERSVRCSEYRRLL